MKVVKLISNDNIGNAISLGEAAFEPEILPVRAYNILSFLCIKASANKPVRRYNRRPCLQVH